MYAEQMPPAEKQARTAPPPRAGVLVLPEADNDTPTRRRKGGKVLERDVNTPKRNMSAYLLYQNAMRDDVSKTTVC